MRRIVTAVVLMTLAPTTAGCGVMGEAGSGVLLTRSFRIPPEIERLEIGDAFRATIRVGAAAGAARITIDDNLLDRLRVDVQGNTLQIDVDGRVRDATLLAEIGLAQLRRLGLSGASHARVVGRLADDLTIEVSGASQVELGPGDLDELVLSASGASTISAAEGSAGHLHADVSGASRIELFGLECDEAELDVSGASVAEVTVRDTIDARASGASQVRYRGDPDRVISDESGASSVEPA